MQAAVSDANPGFTGGKSNPLSRNVVPKIQWTGTLVGNPERPGVKYAAAPHTSIDTRQSTASHYLLIGLFRDK